MSPPTVRRHAVLTRVPLSATGARPEMWTPLEAKPGESVVVEQYVDPSGRGDWIVVTSYVRFTGDAFRARIDRFGLLCIDFLMGAEEVTAARFVAASVASVTAACVWDDTEEGDA